MADWIHVNNRTCRACDGPVIAGVCTTCLANQEEMAEAELEATRERYYEELARLRIDRAGLGIVPSSRRR